MNTDFESIRSAIRNNYLILIGILVFLIIIAFSAFQSIRTQESAAQSRATNESESVTPEHKQYIVKKGDYLWKIAEEAYGSGYNAYDIAEANKLTDPYVLHTDQSLVIPSVQPKAPTKGEILATNTETLKKVEKDTKYTIKKGDTLWSISQQFYGTGYQWSKIASANKLTNASLIHADNTLTIPSN